VQQALIEGPAMRYRRLGNTGLPGSVIGAGTGQLGGEWGQRFTQHEVDQLLGRAGGLGVNHRHRRTGEIEFRDDDIGGIGVHIAARALAQAGDGEVVVIRTVRDLVTGTDLAFSPLGAVELRGIPGAWQLFAASAG
jgi:hypothetical protein